MDAGEISSNALKYPLSDFKKVLILGIITILSSLIIPGFLVLGYFLKIIKSSINGSSELPEFNDWIEMFVDGLKVFVVLFIYSVVPLLLVLSGIWAVLLPVLTVPGKASLLNPSLWMGLSHGLVVGLVFTGAILEIVLSFFITIALANMANHNELRAAFRFREIIDKIKAIGGVDYFIWFVVMIIIAWVAYNISFFLVFPFIVGVIIVPLVISPYFIMFFARSIALVFAFGGIETYRK